jgi:hypothetical protein
LVRAAAAAAVVVGSAMVLLMTLPIVLLGKGLPAAVHDNVVKDHHYVAKLVDSVHSMVDKY